MAKRRETVKKIKSVEEYHKRYYSEPKTALRSATRYVKIGIDLAQESFAEVSTEMSA